MGSDGIRQTSVPDAARCGHDLRAAFPGGDTLSLDRPGPAIALVQVTDELAVRFTSPGARSEPPSAQKYA